MTNRILSKREIRNELFGILAMCDAFVEEGSMVGGKRKEELIKYLPKQIASRLMQLQDLIDECSLGDQFSTQGWDVWGNEVENSVAL